MIEHHSCKSVQNEIWLGAQAEKVDHLGANFDSTVTRVVTSGNLLDLAKPHLPHLQNGEHNINEISREDKGFKWDKARKALSTATAIEQLALND